MARTKRYIKYMVSLRCKMVVKEELEKAGLNYSISPQGAIQFPDEISQNQFDELKENLRRSGLEMLDENDSMLIDRIINTIIEVVHYSDELPGVGFEDIVGETVAGSVDESMLKIFSDVKGIPVMQFVAIQKVERAKELLLYEDLTLSEISQKLWYSNKHHFAAQFKKYTGLSPAYFEGLKNERSRLLQQA